MKQMLTYINICITLANQKGAHACQREIVILIKKLKLQFCMPNPMDGDTKRLVAPLTPGGECCVDWNQEKGALCLYGQPLKTHTNMQNK